MPKYKRPVTFLHISPGRRQVCSFLKKCVPAPPSLQNLAAGDPRIGTWSGGGQQRSAG